MNRTRIVLVAALTAVLWAAALYLNFYLDHAISEDVWWKMPTMIVSFLLVVAIPGVPFIALAYWE